MGILDAITNWVQELCDEMQDAQMRNCKECGKLFKSIRDSHYYRQIRCYDCRNKNGKR